MKQETLKLIGRQHTVEQVVDAFRLARQVGFDNINMDIILGLPGETKEDVQSTIEAITALSPDALILGNVLHILTPLDQPVRVYPFTDATRSTGYYGLHFLHNQNIFGPAEMDREKRRDGL